MTETPSNASQLTAHKPQQQQLVVPQANDRVLRIVFALGIIYVTLAALIAFMVRIDLIGLLDSSSSIAFNINLHFFENQMFILVYQGCYFTFLLAIALLGRSYNTAYLITASVVYQLATLAQYCSLEIPLGSATLLPFSNFTDFYPSKLGISHIVFTLLQFISLVFVRLSISTKPRINTAFIDMAFLTFAIYILMQVISGNIFQHFNNNLSQAYGLWLEEFILRMSLIFGVFGGLYSGIKPTQDHAKLASIHWLVLCISFVLMYIASPFSPLETNRLQLYIILSLSLLALVVHISYCLSLWKIYRQDAVVRGFSPSYIFEFGLLLGAIDFGILFLLPLQALDGEGTNLLWWILPKELHAFWAYLLVSYLAFRMLSPASQIIENQRRKLLMWQAGFVMIGVLLVVIALVASSIFQTRIHVATASIQQLLSFQNIAPTLIPLQLLLTIGIACIIISLILQILTILPAKKVKAQQASIQINTAAHCSNQIYSLFGIILLVAGIYASLIHQRELIPEDLAAQQAHLSPLALEGKDVYGSQGCASCHQGTGSIDMSRIMAGTLYAPSFPFKLNGVHFDQLEYFLTGRLPEKSNTYTINEDLLNHIPDYNFLKKRLINSAVTTAKLVQIQSQHKTSVYSQQEILMASSLTAGKTELEALIIYLLEAAPDQATREEQSKLNDAYDQSLPPPTPKPAVQKTQSLD